MNIIRTTVPRRGTLHHCVSSGGRPFEVLVDGARLRRLLGRRPTGHGMPVRLFVLGREEASRATVRPIPIRLAGPGLTRGKSTAAAT